MTEGELRALLEGLRRGSVGVKEAMASLRRGPLRVDRLPYAIPDHHRSLRQGLTEVVLGEGKEVEELVEIVGRLAAGGAPILVTRVDRPAVRRLQAAFPGARVNERARCVTVNPQPSGDGLEGTAPGEEADGGYVAIVAAGTSDLAVAEEAAEVCRVMRVPVRKAYDVGISGLHRLLERLPEVEEATAVIVVAGMEGALPSVVGGLISRPIFAVPTGVGYGASFGGVAALLAMLNSCAPGVAVLNIDNGFSAGVAASRVVLEARRAAGSRPVADAGSG